MRAVPIQFYSDQGTLANIFSYVNGVLVCWGRGGGGTGNK